MQFSYSAINKEGTVLRDNLEASSYSEAVSEIHKLGLIPTEIKERGANLRVSIFTKFSTVGLQDKILFIQNLGVMLKAGISVTRALKILSIQTKNPKFKKILEAVYEDVEGGKGLAESLQKYPNIFANIFVSMVRVGEMSGNLDKSLEYLTIQLQREHDMITKTKGAMIYPAVIVFAIVIVGGLLTIFVLPALIGIFKDSHAQLPLTTRIVIAFVDFMSGNSLIVLGGLILLVVMAVAAFKSKVGKKIFDTVLLVTPIFGEISKKINMARFSRVMGSMLKSGTPILEGLEVAGQSLNNVRYREAIAEILRQVRLGKGLAASLSEFPRLFSYLATQMIGVGEESGTVDAILEELAQHYEEDVDNTMRNISSVIEPVLILVIGAVVGFLALALISPIYSLTQQSGG